MFSGIFFLLFVWYPIKSQCQSSLFCRAIYKNFLRFPQSCDIIASYPERFLVTNYFWKPSLSYMLLFSNASNFKLWNTIYILQTMWLVIFYSGMPSKLCFIKTLYTSHRLQSHLSFCFLWGWGFGTLILTLNHYFQNEEGIFWNIFNVTALLLLLCLYDGKSCFACLFSFKKDPHLIRGQLIFIKTKHHYQVSDHYILVIRQMLNTFGNSICTWSDPKQECFLEFQNWLMITC